ncbi:MAG TPA: ATP-binding cassette domain-containing protein [Thermoleophilaceae bacterium]|nr:ATP-binding cassette domain-containing protein [Thermoleophilaceae bacterium]
MSKSFWRGQSELSVLKEVSLEVRAGELVAVYGQRGSGKTTLLQIAAGFERPGRGRVTFEGRDVAELSHRDLARLHREQIGWVERAGPHSRDLPIQSYLALALYRRLGRRAAERRAQVALAKVGAADCAAQRWDDLSDTARTLVAIAQALVREPRLLIVDDPTAGLGIIDRERIVGLLRSAAEEGGIGVLMAVPDMPAMLHAHQLRFLGRGRLLAPPQPSTDDPDGDVIDFPGDKRTA